VIATAGLQLLALGALLVAAPTGGGRERPAAAAAAHDVHLSHARVVVEGATVVMRVRIFRDDLEAALGARIGRAGYRISATPAADSILGAYVNEAVTLTHAGRALRGTIVASGEDRELADNPMWWADVRYDAPVPVRSLAIRNDILFDLFDDQRNMMKVLALPAGKQFTFYFVEGDEGARAISW
jgi:hypothetical protein